MCETICVLTVFNLHNKSRGRWHWPCFPNKGIEVPFIKTKRQLSTRKWETSLFNDDINEELIIYSDWIVLY